MTLLPGTNYMSGPRTEAEMKIALERVNEVIAEIGSQDVTTLKIGDSVGNGITTPLSSMVSIEPEFAGVADTLATIAVSNIDKGRMVILQHANSSGSTESTGITITHGIGAGAIEMKDSMDFILCSKRMLGLIYTGATGHWQEVWRGYGRSTAEEKLAERVDMGLGTASVEHMATSSVNAGRVLKVGTALVGGDVLKIDGDGQISKATITTNATTLNGEPSTEYVRKTGTAAQSIDADLTVATANASLIADGTSTAALRLKATVGGTTAERARVMMDATNGELMLRTQLAGGTPTPSIRLNPGGADGEKFQFAVDDSTWQSLTPGAGNGLNADLLDDHHWSEIALIAATSFRRTHFKSATQTDLGHWNSPSEPQNEYGEPLVDLMNLEYPIAPNGSRRFNINASIVFIAQSTDTTSREGKFGIWSHPLGANIRYPSNANWHNYFYFTQISNPTENRYYTAVCNNRVVTPATNDVVTIQAGEDQVGDTDVKSDIGYGPMDDPVVGSTTSSSSRGRTYIQITYLDEG